VETPLASNSALDGLISLFDGKVEGSVLNPYTGTFMKRRDVLDLYRFMLWNHISLPSDEWTESMLVVIKELLGIPPDLHQDLMIAFGTKVQGEIDTHYKKHIMDEMESIRFFRKGLCHKDKVVVDVSQIEAEIGGGASLSGDLLELERGSLIEQMRRDEGIVLGEDTTLSTDFSIYLEPGIMDDMVHLFRHGPKKR
jgi:hypothetical protein